MTTEHRRRAARYHRAIEEHRRYGIVPCNFDPSLHAIAEWVPGRGYERVIAYAPSPELAALVVDALEAAYSAQGGEA